MPVIHHRYGFAKSSKEGGGIFEGRALRSALHIYLFIRPFVRGRGYFEKALEVCRIAYMGHVWVVHLWVILYVHAAAT